MAKLSAIKPRGAPDASYERGYSGAAAPSAAPRGGNPRTARPPPRTRGHRTARSPPPPPRTTSLTFGQRGSGKAARGQSRPGRDARRPPTRGPGVAEQLRETPATGGGERWEEGEGGEEGGDGDRERGGGALPGAANG